MLGALSVMISGARMMLMLSVDSWDTETQVLKHAITFVFYFTTKACSYYCSYYREVIYNKIYVIYLTKSALRSLHVVCKSCMLVLTVILCNSVVTRHII